MKRAQIVEPILRSEATVGECPTWDDKEEKLYWVDIPEKKLHCFDPGTKENQTYDFPEVVPCLGLRQKGGLILALQHDLVFFNPKTTVIESVARVETNLSNNRFNDGKVDPQGRFWAGTMDSVELENPGGALYMLNESHVPKLMQSYVTCSNGLGWSPDCRTMYLTESFRHSIFVYEFEPESGEISNRNLFVEIENHKTFPDGLTVDSEGFVWFTVRQKFVVMIPTEN
jgi:sugar lactone lactonase YvrE